MIIDDLTKEFKEEYGQNPRLIVSSPGRLDFLNTHQDYKGLPVVSIGVNLRSYTAIAERADDYCYVLSVNLKRERVEYKDVFKLTELELRSGKWFGNYLRAAVKSLIEQGYKVKGFNAAILSEVPIGGGLGSSAAFTVSFLGALNEIFSLNLSRKEIAEVAYHAEHDIMGIPCGRLDQYGSVFGGVIKIETRPPYNVEELP
ncbi:MAG: GHMP kinase, partial [Desulfurococcales archaeon ex4484_217_2]